MGGYTRAAWQIVIGAEVGRQRGGARVGRRSWTRLVKFVNLFSDELCFGFILDLLGFDSYKYAYIPLFC